MITLGQAIKESIQTNTAPQFDEDDCVPGIIEDLICEAAQCDGDSEIISGVWDFWGKTLDGREWRVHIKTAAQKQEEEFLEQEERANNLDGE